MADPEPDSPQRHRRANTIGQLLPLVMGYGLTFLSTPIVVSQLGVRGFGIWAVSGAFAQYAALLDLGMGRGIVRFVALYRAQGDRRREGQVVSTSLVVLGIIALLLPFLAYAVAPLLRGVLAFADVEQARTVLCGASVILGAGMVTQGLCSASFGKGRMVNGNIAGSLSKASSVIGGLIALWVSPTLGSFAIGNAIGSIVGLALCALYLATIDKGIAHARPSFAILKQQLDYGYKGQLMMISELVVFQSDKIVIGVIVGPTAAGAYELGNRLALAAREVAVLAGNSMTPELTHAFAHEGIAGVRAKYLDLTRVTTGISSLPLLFVAAAAPLILDGWLGDAPGLSVTVVVALCAAYTLNAATAVTTVAAAAIGRPGLPAIYSWIAAIVNVVLAIPLTLLLGAEGVLLATGIAVVVGASTAFVLFNRTVEVSGRSILAALDSYLVGIPVALVVAAIAFLIPQPDRILALVIACGLGVLFVALYLPAGIRLGFLPRLIRRG